MNPLNHVAIIMDGNGRWAELKNKKRVKGHEAGAKVVKEITKYCSNIKDIERLIGQKIPKDVVEGFEPDPNIRRKDMRELFVINAELKLQLQKFVEFEWGILNL